jgi:hypothetical protein
VGEYDVWILTEIDVGRLVAEALLILASTGAVIVVLNLFKCRSPKTAEPVGTPDTGRSG